MFVILIFLCFIKHIHAEICTTPNKEEAECISLYQCPTLLKGLATQEADVIKFVTESHCGKWKQEPLVCCGTTSKFQGAKKPVADPRICGYQHADDYFRADTVTTAIDEFPWLAVLKYIRDPDLAEDDTDKYFFEIACSGVLLNHRHVLTAANCLKLRTSTAVGVRLGEYNIKQNRDCTNNEVFETCADPVLDIQIAQKIKHPNYNRRFGLNDIALLKLATSLIFSDYIRPICLPTPDTNLPKIGEVTVASGFGRLHANEIH